MFETHTAVAKAAAKKVRQLAHVLNQKWCVEKEKMNFKAVLKHFQVDTDARFELAVKSLQLEVKMEDFYNKTDVSEDNKW